MGKIYELQAMEGLLNMEAEEMPLDIWLPYVQLESERFICKDSGEIWQRFEGVTVYMEDEDYPEGDLIEEFEKAPAGLVCWQGKKGAVPEAGDVFRVMDGNNQVVFEEVISGTTWLLGKHYACAQKEGEMTRDLLLDMEQTLKGNMGDMFGNNLLNYAGLEEASSMEEIKYEEKILFYMRGIPFFMIVDERETHSPCRLTFYEADGMRIHGYEQELAAGDKWYEVKYRAVSDEGPAMCVGWGVGSAKEAAEKIRGLLEKPLEEKLEEAQERSISGTRDSEPGTRECIRE